MALSNPPNPATWMTGLAHSNPKFGHLRLSQICIPGSHDSACYEFKFPIPAVTTMAKTQFTTIALQLQAGARFLDLRPRWDAGAGAFYIYHGDWETVASLSTVLQETSSFAAANPGELLFLYFSHQDPDRVNQLAQAIQSGLPSQVFTPSSGSLNDATYAQLVNQGQNIVLINDAANTPTGFWSNTAIANIDNYANTSQISNLIAFINTQLGQHAQSPTPWMLQCQLTPSVLGGVFSAGQQGPLQLAADSMLSVLARLDPRQHADAAKSLNLFIVDAYNGLGRSIWTDLAYSINLTRV